MKYILSLTLLVGIFCAIAQQADQAVESAVPTDSIPFEIRKQAYIYNLSRKYNDPAVTRMALYNLIASSENSLNLMDSLALMYLEYEQNASAALISQDILSINANDMFATEIAAIAFENLGVVNRSVEYYERLYLNTNNIGTLYKIAFQQYQLERYEESIVNVDAIIENPKAEQTVLYFPVANQQNQPVPMKIVAIRLKGMIEQERGNIELAKSLFQEAITLKPDFQILKQQIAEMENPETKEEE